MRSHRSRPIAVATVLVALVALPAAFDRGRASTPDAITVYSALDQRVTAEIVRAFEAHSGIDADVLAVAAASTLAARIKSEKANPRADVFVGGGADFYVPLAADGLLLPYKSLVSAESKIDPAFVDPDGHWYGWYLSTLAIVVNRDRYQKIFAPKGPRIPKTWDELLNPAYKGHLAMPSPATTVAGYVFAATQVFRLGEEKAFEYLRALVANASQITPTVALAVQLAARGDALLAVNWSHEAFAARQRDDAIEVVIPPDTGFEVGSVSIVKGGPNPEGAKAFVDFLLGKPAQELAARVYLRHPARPDVMPAAEMRQPGGLKLVNYDREWAMQNRARLQKKWQAEIPK